jgi:hypothetical protein
MRIIYRCWKDGKPYDEAIYMQSLRRRGSLLAGCLRDAQRRRVEVGGKASKKLSDIMLDG